MKTPIPNPVGRPAAPINLLVLAEAAGRGMTMSEIAKALGVSDTTFRDRVAKDDLVRTTYRKARIRASEEAAAAKAAMPKSPIPRVRAPAKKPKLSKSGIDRSVERERKLLLPKELALSLKARAQELGTTTNALIVQAIERLIAA